MLLHAAEVRCSRLRRGVTDMGRLAEAIEVDGEVDRRSFIGLQERT
jgi:hypothetical protein